MMRRSHVYWPLVLLLPLLLLTLTGCGQCGDVGLPNYDPHFLSANGLMYLNSPESHSLYAIDMKSGSIQWTYQVSGTTLLLDSDVLSIQDDTYKITALDAATGNQLWQKDGRDANGHVTSLEVAADHLVYLSEEDGTLEALNGRTGALLWQHRLSETPSAVLARNGVAYMSTENYSDVYAFRERDGALLWHFYGGQGQNIPTVFGDGMIFLSAGETYALRMSDGALLWNAPQTGGLLEANDVLYVNTAAPMNALSQTSAAASSADVFAFGASDGKQLWHQSFVPNSTKFRPEIYDMQLSDNQLYLFPISAQYPTVSEATPPAFLYAFGANDGKPLWKATLPARKFSLVALQGVLYLFSGADSLFDTGVLEAVSETDGAVRWSQSVQEAGWIIGSDAIYLGTTGNTDDPCELKSSVQLEKRQMSAGTLLWHRQLDPAPDSLRLVEVLLAILGGLLVVLGLALYFLSFRKRAEPALRALPGEPARMILSASIPLAEHKRWLLLLVMLGLALLFFAAVVALRAF
jgi:outer membrane protein assembly factor BamB